MRTIPKRLFQSCEYLGMLVLLGFLCLGSGLFAENQPATLDSLRSLALQQWDSPEKAGLAHYNLAKYYRISAPDSAIRYAKMAISDYKGLPPEPAHVFPNIAIAEAYYHSNRFKKALPWIEKAEEMAAPFPSDSLKGMIAFLKGNILGTMDEFDASLKSLERSLEFNRKAGNRKIVGRAYLNIGRQYYILEKNDDATQFFKLGIDILTEEKDSVSLAIGLQNYAGALSSAGDTLGSIEHYEWAISILRMLPDKSYGVFPLYNVAKHYIDQGKIDLARSRMQEADAIASESNMVNAKILAKEGFASVLRMDGELNKAIEAIKEAWELGSEFGETTLQVDILAAWKEMEEEAGNYKEVLRLERMERDLDKKMMDLERSKYFEELTVKYETERTAAENELLVERKDRLESRQRWGIGLGILLALFFAGGIGILISANARRKAFNRALALKNSIIEHKNTALESRNKDLQQTNQEKDALMAVVAHDLKAPLTKIMAMTELLDASKDDPEQFQQVKERIEQVLRGGQGLIEELVFLSALEKPGLEMELTEVEVGNALRENVADFQAPAAEKDIALHYEGVPGPVTGLLQREHFDRILDNLLSNAVKFSASGSQVYVSLRAGEQDFVIQVRDEGPGISEEELPRIFEKFTRLSPRPTGGEASTGLGMSIVKELVQRMKGEIEVESKVGAGTVFRLRFPLA